MDLLPDLALLEVFSFVSVEERFEILRLVCRRWRLVVEFQIQQDLIVYEDLHPFKCRWPSDNRQIDSLNAVGKLFFAFSLLNGYCKGIKRLFLYQIVWTSFQRNELMAKLADRLCQLEELSIEQQSSSCTWAPYTRKNVSFDLNGLIFPNLRVLSVKQEFQTKANVIAPRLEKLVLWDRWFNVNQARGLAITLSHPECLKSLECDIIDDHTRLFSNLTHLSAQHVKRNFHLSNHLTLKRLDLCVSTTDFYGPIDFYETVEDLVKQRKELKLNDLEITNFGAKEDVFGQAHSFTNEFSGYFDCGEDSIDHFVKNFTVDHLPWNIGFSDLLYHHKGLSELCRSRLNIRYVFVGETQPPDPTLLIKFLVDIDGVKCLSIGDQCPLGQEFYDQLPKVPYIAILNTRGHLLVQNFEFISSIRFLSETRLMVRRSAVDSLWEAFRRSKIKRFWIKLSREKLSWRAFGPTLEFNLNKFVLRNFAEFREIKFDCLDAAFASFKKEIENLHDDR